MRARRARSIAALRCPRCLEGRVFRGAMDMRERCPVCGLVFEREPGYFTGAMVVAYVLAVGVYAIFALALWLLAGWPVEAALAAAVVPLLVAAPAVFRYSRVLWLHLDHAIDPQRS